MKEKWLIVCEGFILFNSCMASSKEEAINTFRTNTNYTDWSESDVISEADYIQDNKALLV